MREVYVLPASSCEIHGGDICFEEPFGNVGYWHGADDHVSWALQVPKDATFDVWLDASCDDGSAGNRYVIEGGLSPLRGAVAGTGGWDRYVQKKVGQITLTAGTPRLTVRPDGPPRGALMDLRAVHLVPPGVVPVFARQAKEETPKDAASLAKLLIEGKLPGERRQALINENVGLAAELIAAITAGLKPGEESKHTGRLWQIAIAAGRKNDAAVLRKVLEVSLPKAGQPLMRWQVIVVGGGVVNGITLAGQWPDERVAELIKDSKDLQARWARSIELSSPMADDPKVSAGTRYDALRMIAMDPRGKHIDQLAKYLAKGTNDELMQGAVSGLADARSPKVAALLIGGLGHYSAGNRKFAIEGLLRTDERAAALLGALEAGKVAKALLDEEHRKALRNLKDEELRRRAERLFGG
jgi:hypothetical protein